MNFLCIMVKTLAKHCVLMANSLTRLVLGAKFSVVLETTFMHVKIRSPVGNINCLSHGNTRCLRE